MVVFWVHYLILVETFPIWVKPKVIQSEGMLEFIKRVLHCSFPFVLYSLYEKSSTFACYLPDKKLRHSHVPGYEGDRLDFTNNFRILFLFLNQNDQNEASDQPYFGNPHWTHPTFLNSLHCHQINAKTLWNFCFWTSHINAIQYSIMAYQPLSII